MTEETAALRLIEATYRLQRAIAEDVRAHVAEAADLELSDFMMLKAIADGIDSPSALAAELCWHRASTSRHITAMVRAGLLNRTTGDIDSRRTALSLTPAGRETVEKIKRRVRPQVAARLDRLDEKTAGLVLDALETLLQESMP